MIRSHFGLAKNPFEADAHELLAHQRDILDILLVHAAQGGLCLILGEAGSGKTTVKNALIRHDTKRLVTPVVNRTLHTWHNTLRILCEAFQVEFQGHDHACEKRLLAEAFKLHRNGRQLVPIIDDAHLMPSECLRKLRVLFEDFPRSHNLVLIGQPPLLQTLQLSINEEIKSRVTYSVVLPRLAPEQIETFVLDQFDRCGLSHSSFTPEALALVVRSGDGLLRRTKNLCVGSLIEAVRDQARTVDLRQVNRVLMQPHWRNLHDAPAAETSTTTAHHAQHVRHP